MGEAIRGGKGALTGDIVVAGLAVLARLREDDRPGEGRDRVGPVPEGRPGRRAPARRAQPAVAAAPTVARLPRPVRRGLRLRQRRSATSRSAQGLAATNNLRMRGAAAVVLMEGSADLERETAGPARRRRSRDQRRHGVARRCGDQPGDRPRHVPGPILPEKAADRGEHARIPRHRAWDDPKVERVERSSLGETRRRPTPPRRARAHGDALRSSEPHEDRRRADGLDAERRAEPRGRARASSRRPPPKVPSWSSCPSTSASWARADRDKLAVAEAPGDGPIQRMLAESAREHGVWLIGGTLPLTTQPRAGAGATTA